MNSVSIKKAVKKHAYRAAKAIVDEIKYDKCQHEYPEQADGKFQDKIYQPQRQQAGKECKDRIFMQVVHCL